MKNIQITLITLVFWMSASVAAANEPVIHQVQVATVVEKNVHEMLHVYGKVSFDDAWLQNINLAYGGQIVRLPVLAGELVSKGQVLARIAIDPAASAAYQQAVAAAHFAESQQKRIRSLFADQLATRSEIAAAQKNLTDSRLQVRQLKLRGMDKLVHEIRAPFDAVVATIPVQAGQRVAAGFTLMQLGHPNHLKVLLGIEADDVRSVLPGNAVEIHPALNPKTQVTASVDTVLHAVNPKTRLADVLVRLSGKQTAPFLPGMTVSADIAARRFLNALVVPRHAVMYGRNNAAYVMRIEHGKAIRIPVQMLMERGNDIVIRGALKAGQQVITVGVAEVANGDAVMARPAK